MSEAKDKIVVIAGSTATGKSDIGVKLAQEYNGEVISADSRQIYKGMEIGTGAVTTQEAEDIPHHLIGFRSPKNPFTAADFAKKAERLIGNITKRGKLPIVVGGTGFYIEALLYENTLPEVPPNPALRKKLEQKTTKGLFADLQDKDPERAETIDPHNKRRLVRALEVVNAIGKVPSGEKKAKYDALQIGITLPDDELKERIRTRVQKRLENGWIEEVRKLRENGVSWKRLEEISLGYKIIADFLRGNVQKDELEHLITTAEYQYAKRQKKWFKRDPNIYWIHPNDTKEAKRLVEQFTK